MEDFTPGSDLYGFTVVSVTELPEYDGKGIRLRHISTGLELFHIANTDPENFFAFIFKTPPRNSNGTAHIVEHAVLAGSKRFPVKDPFLELLKGSAQTFMNAMTYPDKTVYPAASPLEKDYFHLLEVYGDAVFFPLLKREIFMQEGIRQEIGENGHIRFDGIVFNEMKGAMSDTDGIVYERSIQSLFPDTPYRYNSGGDPSSIVRLSFEEFKGFHAEFYHPSNCRVFLYGSIPLERQLEFLEERFLQQFTKTRTDADIQVPRPWTAPENHRFSSPTDGEDEQGAERGTVTINWIAGDSTDPMELMTWELLTEALLGNPGAPLYHEIIQSGLGEDIASISGMDSEYRSTVFSLGIKGINADKAEEFERLILTALERLVEQGIPEESIRTAIKRIEFQQAEIKGGMPTGLRALSRAVRGWLHGATPETTLVFRPIMEGLKNRLIANEHYLVDFLDQRLIKNRHRSVVTVMPDPLYRDRQERCIQRIAQELEEKFTKKDKKRLIEEMKQLRKFQETPDTFEQMALIPRLALSDMPTDISTIVTESQDLLGVTCHLHPIFSNGIVYLDFAVDVKGLPYEEMMLLPLFSRLIYMTGMPGSTYDEVSRLIAEKTGGFYTYLDTGIPVGSEEPSEYLFFRCKCLYEDVHEAISLIGDVLFTSELWDIKRIKDIILEQRQDFSSEMIPSGSAFVSLRASSHFSSAIQREDQWRGLTQLFFLHTLDTQSEESLRDIARTLGQIRDRVFVRSRLTCNVTTGDEHMRIVTTLLRQFIERFPEGTPEKQESTNPFLVFDTGHLLKNETMVFDPPAGLRPWEMFTTSTDVSFHAMALPAAALGDPLHVALAILATILSTNHLWERIRVSGGAYSAHAGVSLLDGIFGCSTYRDPRIVDSRNDIMGVFRQITDQGISAEIVEKAIISIVSKDIKPLSPREQSMTGFRRILFGIDDAIRRRRREEFLSLESAQVIDAASMIAGILEGGTFSFASLTAKDLIEPEMRRVKPFGLRMIKLP